MSDPAILFVKPNAISASDKKALQAAGVIVVEIENPADAQFVRAHAELASTVLLRAAATAIVRGRSEGTKNAFADAVCAAIQNTGTPTEPCG